MALTTDLPPDNARRLAAESWQRLAPVVAQSAHFGWETTATASVDLALPHPIYTMTLEQLLQHLPLRRAQRTGLRYLVLAGERTVGGVELAVDEPGSEQFHFSRLQPASEMAQTERSLEIAALIERQVTTPLQIQIFQAPALYTEALLLRAIDPADTLFIPFASAPQGLRAFRPYRQQRFLAVLYETAEQVQLAVSDISEDEAQAEDEDEDSADHLTAEA